MIIRHHEKNRDGHRDGADYGSVLTFQDVQTVMGLLLSSGCKLKKNPAWQVMAATRVTKLNKAVKNDLTT